MRDDPTIQRRHEYTQAIMATANAIWERDCKKTTEAMRLHAAIRASKVVAFLSKNYGKNMLPGFLRRHL